MRLADDADRSFLEVAGVLFRLVTWSRPFLRAARPTGQDAIPGEPAESALSGEPDSPEATGSEQRFFASLAEQVDQILRRGPRSIAQGPARAGGGPIGDGEHRDADRVTRNLFHESAVNRMAAARWIREHHYADAIPTLEGVLSIEEDDQVRQEILFVLATLRSSVQKQGAIGC